MTPLVALVAACLGLAVAPLIYRATTASDVLARFVDGFVCASILVLVMFHLLPDAVGSVGASAVVAGLLGLVTPLVMERVSHVSARRTHRVALVFAGVGLIVHAIVDGLALSSPAESGHGLALSAAVVLHRLPVGLALWWLARPRFGPVVAWGVLLAAIAATVVGYAAGEPIWALATASSVALFQAYVGGVLLHVIFHQPGAHSHGHDHGHGHGHGHGHEDHGHDHGHGHEDHGHAAHGHDDHGHDDRAHAARDERRTAAAALAAPSTSSCCASKNEPAPEPEPAASSCCSSKSEPAPEPAPAASSCCASKSEPVPAPQDDEEASCCASEKPKAAWREWRWAESIGAAAGIGAVLLMPEGGDAHGHAHAGHAGHAAHGAGAHVGHAAEHAAHAATTFGGRLLDLCLESAPALLLGFVLAGLVTAFLPRASVRWLGSGHPATQSLRGMAFGLPLPICSCGVVPMYQSLVRRGAPPSAAMAFLVATPEVGLEAIALSVPFLGAEMTVLRLVAAALVALAVGWLVGGRMGRGAEHIEADDVAPELSAMERLRNAMKFGLVDVLDTTAAWLLVGLFIAAAIEPSVLDSWLDGVPNWAQVGAFALLGLPMYVCASGATPLAAALILAGASPGSAIAFLIAGPATNATTYGVLARLHAPRIAILFGATVLVSAVACGIAVDALFPSLTIPPSEGGHGMHASPIAWVSFGILAVAFLGAFVRQGPREFLGTFVALGDDHAHA